MYTSVLLLATLSANTPAQVVQGCYGCYGTPTARHVTANVKGDKVVVDENQVRYVQVVEERMEKIKNKDGIFEEVRQTVMRTQAVPYQMQQTYDAGKVQFLDNEGKKVPSVQAMERLDKATPVLAVLHGQSVDPAYLSLLKKGTLVLILPVVPPSPQKFEKPMPKEEKPLDKGSVISVVGDEEPKTSNGVQPILAKAHIDAKGIAHLQETAERTETVDVKVAENVDGVPKEWVVQMKYSRSLITNRSVDAKWVKAQSADGKAIDAKGLAERLPRPVTVLVSADGKRVDPYYLQIIRDDTIVLMVPVPNVSATMPIDPKTMPKRDPAPK